MKRRRTQRTKRTAKRTAQPQQETFSKRTIVALTEFAELRAIVHNRIESDKNSLGQLLRTQASDLLNEAALIERSADEI